MLVGTSPGGINDISARLVARHLGRFIPGNPSVVVQNNPGRRRARHRQPALSSTPRRTAPCSPSSSARCRSSRSRAIRNAQFDPMKFIWLGSLSSYADDAYLMLINANHPVKIGRRTQAARRPPIMLGADNAASSNLIFARHRQGSARPQRQCRARLYRRGAACFWPCSAASSTASWSGMSSVQAPVSATSGTAKAFRPLMAFGRTNRHPEFPDMPTGRELTERSRARWR